MMEDEQEQQRREARERFLRTHVFHGLRDQNDGFDSPVIAYFTAGEFAVVLERVRTLGLGIHGIEPWQNGDFYAVATPRRGTEGPRDPAWYLAAFARFQAEADDLLYAASFDVPDELLDLDDAT